MVLDSDMDDASPMQVTIGEYFKHPGYKDPSKYNDIALFKLENAITFNQYIRPACLPEYYKPKTANAIVTGWGATEYKGEGSQSLLKVVLEVYNHDECDRTYLNDRNDAFADGIRDDTQWCAGSHTQKKDTCQVCLQ